MQHVIIFSSFHCKKDNRRDLLLASYFKEYVSSVSRKVLNCGQHKQTNKQKIFEKFFFPLKQDKVRTKDFILLHLFPLIFSSFFDPFLRRPNFFNLFLLRCANAAKSLHHIFDLVFVNIINFFRVILMVFSQLSLSLVNVILNEQNSCL